MARFQRGNLVKRLEAGRWRNTQVGRKFLRDYSPNPLDFTFGNFIWTRSSAPFRHRAPFCRPRRLCLPSKLSRDTPLSVSLSLSPRCLVARESTWKFTRIDDIFSEWSNHSWLVVTAVRYQCTKHFPDYSVIIRTISYLFWPRKKIYCLAQWLVSRLI